VCERDGALELRDVYDESIVEPAFAAATRAWLGDVFFDRSQIAEPGAGGLFALIVDGDPVELVEYDEPFGLLADARARTGTRVLGMRVTRLKRDPWPAHLRDLLAQTIFSDDDQPRLVLADALGGDRGALVIAQCELARGPASPQAAAIHRRLQRELLAKHGADWSGLRGLATSCTFRRGFVEVVEPLPGKQVLDIAPHTRSLAGDTAGDSRIVARAFDRIPHPDDVRLLRAVSIRGAGPDDAVEQLPFTTLETLKLPDHRLYPGEVIEIIRDARALRVLDLIGDNPARDPDLAQAVPPWVRQLHAAIPLDVLVAHAPQLAKLELRDSGVSSDLLAGFEALRSLDMAGCAPVDELRADALPMLRELRCARLSSARQLRAIATELGPQLHLLDVRGIASAAEIADELRALVAGDVWFGPDDNTVAPLLASYRLLEPMWDLGTVRGLTLESPR